MSRIKQIFLDGCVYCFIGTVSIVSLASAATIIWVLAL